MRAYIAGALTGIESSSELLHLYESVADVCVSLGCEVYLPHAVKKEVENKRVASPRLIFDWDVANLIASDFVVAFVGIPSIGVGVELGVVASLNIPIIAVSKVGAAISPMVLGHPGLRKHISYRYEEDCLDQLCRTVSALLPSADEPEIGMPRFRGSLAA